MTANIQILECLLNNNVISNIDIVSVLLNLTGLICDRFSNSIFSGWICWTSRICCYLAETDQLSSIQKMNEPP